jgi:hypothetical protein
MKTHALIIKIGAKKPKNIRNCESAVSLPRGAFDAIQNKHTSRICPNPRGRECHLDMPAGAFAK